MIYFSVLRVIGSFLYKKKKKKTLETNEKNRACCKVRNENGNIEFPETFSFNALSLILFQMHFYFHNKEMIHTNFIIKLKRISTLANL